MAGASRRYIGSAALDVERVLRVVEQIPCGLVMSYGEVAELVGSRSARAVGQVLARRGHEVPWHRVVMSDGGLARHKAVEQAARLRADRTPMAGARQVDMRRARWQA